jgi:hypothetical protein
VAAGGVMNIETGAFECFDNLRWFDDGKLCHAALTLIGSEMVGTSSGIGNPSSVRLSM